MLFRIAFAATISTIVVLGMHAACPAAEPPTAQTATVRDGSHDFDFIYGKFKMTNHRLKKRLAGSHQWDDFISCDEGQPLPGGIGNTDYFTASYWKNFAGVTFRTYDPKTGLWRIYWVDNTFSGGVIQPPVVGKFEDNVGIFKGPDTFHGIPIVVRYTWTMNPPGSEIIAKWNQAFSKDKGKTWETNWYNELIRDDSCTLAA